MLKEIKNRNNDISEIKMNYPQNISINDMEIIEGIFNGLGYKISPKISSLQLM